MVEAASLWCLDPGQLQSMAFCCMVAGAGHSPMADLQHRLRPIASHCTQHRPHGHRQQFPQRSNASLQTPSVLHRIIPLFCLPRQTFSSAPHISGKFLTYRLGVKMLSWAYPAMAAASMAAVQKYK